jgi:hypothetical protein
LRSAAKVAKVRKLLGSGMSSRKIARETGVNRGTVAKIADGQSVTRVSTDGVELFDDGPVGRCETCGGMVVLPCRLCRVRAMKNADRLAGVPGDASPFTAKCDAIELDLMGELQQRLDEVRAARQQNPPPVLEREYVPRTHRFMT